MAEENTENAAETTEKEKPGKAKIVSLVSKITGALLIIAGVTLKGFNKLPGVTVKEIIFTGVAAAAVGCGTIDINIILDKFLSK